MLVGWLVMFNVPSTARIYNVLYFIYTFFHSNSLKIIFIGKNCLKRSKVHYTFLYI